MEVVATETVNENMVSIRRDTLAISILDAYIRFESNRENLTGEPLQTSGNKGTDAFFG
jgi:hypothetical protein